MDQQRSRSFLFFRRPLALSRAAAPHRIAPSTLSRNNQTAQRPRCYIRPTLFRANSARHSTLQITTRLQRYHLGRPRLVALTD